MSGENELKPESGFICDECHYARKLRPKSPPDSKGATWFCHCCGHWNIGSIVPIKRDRSGHPTPIQSAPNDEPKSKVVKCPTCSTDLIMADEDAKEMMLRATQPATEVVPEGTLELLGKICARFREIEYQHELNHPHIGDGILYEMLEDLNSILATRIIDMVREHDSNHIADAGKMVKIGDFTLSNDPPIDGKIWINRESGEGGSFDLAKFEKHVESFYKEHF